MRTKRLTWKFLLLLAFMPATSFAWWNDGWDFRKQIRADMPAASADVSGTVSNVPVLVRLSFGNFAFFGDVKPDGSDIRFVAADDMTPLPFYIEKFDSINQQALIWVQVPQLSAGAATNFVYMYYGNPDATAAADGSSVYGPETVLVYDFAGPDGQVSDVSGYRNDPSSVAARGTDTALIGRGVEFAGPETIDIPPSPNLGVSSENGFALSVWLRPAEIPAGDVSIVSSRMEEGSLDLGLRGPAFRLSVLSGDIPTELIAADVEAVVDEWVHLAARLEGTELALFVNGESVGVAETLPIEFTAGWTLGDPLNGFAGQIDQLQLVSAPMDAAAIRFAAQAEAPFSATISYGEDAQREQGGGQSYIAVTLRNVTVDGWVVISILAVMAVISWIVTVMKSMLLSRIERQNAHFLADYVKLTGDPLALQQEGSELDPTAEESLLDTALEDDASYHPSTLFPLYQMGAVEVKKRMDAGRQKAGESRGALTMQAIDAIRSSVNVALVRQRQKMNRLMVLLTIAISGGPFLGLLGTVVGVMITFAAIAASGDVNVNAIAPGVAAALASTVVGLFVAIPALFAYNWLGTRIKDIDANTRVFADEFVNRIAEYRR